MSAPMPPYGSDRKEQTELPRRRPLDVLWMSLRCVQCRNIVGTVVWVEPSEPIPDIWCLSCAAREQSRYALLSGRSPRFFRAKVR